MIGNKAKVFKCNTFHPNDGIACCPLDVAPVTIENKPLYFRIFQNLAVVF